MKNNIKNKGVFFSIDVAIALIVLLMVILVVYPVAKSYSKESYVQNDLFDVLSSVKTGEINNVYVQGLIADGNITDLNKPMIDQIGEFYVTDPDIAKEILNQILSSLDTNENIGIFIDDVLIASKNTTSLEDAKDVEVETRLISGIKNGSEVTGYSARAYLKSALQTKYYYFGGYVGEGNISVNINYTGDIKDVELEIAVNKDFDIYINDNYASHYQNSSNQYTPAKYDLENYTVLFNSGPNELKIVGDNLYVAGGFVKVQYENVEYIRGKKYYFPGVEGLINLYDGFYIPNDIQEMDIMLHMDTNVTTYLIIGNTTVYSNVTDGEETIYIDDSELSGMLDYTELAKNTVPLRLGMLNVSYTSNITRNADSISVTDLSGSMQECDGGGLFCCWFSQDCTTESGCTACGGTFNDKLTPAKEADKAFIDALLNFSGNRVGLVGYSTSFNTNDYHELSSDNLSLKTEVDSWDSGGNTCICCGINKAVEDLVDFSDSDKFRSIVVMSDGLANRVCSEQGTGDARQDAIQAACDAQNNYGIVVHAVGFGSDADTSTLQSIANCGNGSYYYSDISNLTAVYEIIAKDIIEASYNEQTVNFTDQVDTKIFPDSYIKFIYDEPERPYGLIITAENNFSNEFSGNFSIPKNSTIIEANVISYSGPRWTKYVEINGNQIYNLTDYGVNYTELGDPYSIEIPLSQINENNTVTVLTGLSPSNTVGGSINNKVITKIIKEMIAYSGVSPKSEGCIWDIEYYDNTTTTITAPSTYSESNSCFYNSTDEIYNDLDARQQAVYLLLKVLDFNNDGRIDVKFDEQNFLMDSYEYKGIPFSTSTTIKIIRWR